MDNSLKEENFGERVRKVYLFLRFWAQCYRDIEFEGFQGYEKFLDNTYTQNAMINDLGFEEVMKLYNWGYTLDDRKK